MNPAEYFNALKDVFNGLDIEKVRLLISKIVDTQKAGKTVYVFGNGGSGANASHFVQDLLKCPVKNFESPENRFRAMCLNDNIPVITAYSNDLSFSEIFKQQLMNFCVKGDLVIGLSGSGKSQNIIRAIEYANTVGAVTFGVVGFEGAELLKTASMSLHIKTSNMQLYEDVCMSVLHGVISTLKPL